MKLKEELDDLKLKYAEESKCVELIKLYCETYKEWPNYSNTGKKNEVQGKTGKQLADWLKTSGYNNGEFKYDVKLKEELDDLKLKYAQEIVTPEKYVELIKLYCEMYKEWPNGGKTGKKNEIQGKTGKQLVAWLNHSGYNKDEFKYENELKKKLDNLKAKYVQEIITPEKYVELIKLYCETYKEWPNEGKTGKKNEVQGKTGVQLATWLFSSEYNKGKFKYGDVLKQKLDDLKLKYAITPEKYVELIKLYCETYKEWLKHGEAGKKYEIQGKTGVQLASWLNTSGYNKGEFKYDVKLKEELDDLKLKYAQEIVTPEKYVELIKLYCEKYKEWPNKGKTRNKYEIQGKTGVQLADWLKTSGYNKGKFKHGDTLKQELDNLKAIYYKSKKSYDAANQSFNEESHFQSVIESLQNSKENSNGRKVH